MGKYRSKTHKSARGILTFGLSVGLLVGITGLAPAAASAATNPSGTEVLSTSPTTKCAADDIVGLDDMTLVAQNTAPVGSSMTTSFDLAVAGTTTNLLDSNAGVTQTGTSVIYTVPRTVLEAASTGNFTEYTWTVSAAVGSQPPIKAKTCDFTMDFTRPGVPVVTGN